MKDASEPSATGVDPRRLAAFLGLIVVAALLVGIIVFINRPDGPIDDVSFSRESTATVLYAGRFPADDEPALLNPLGIDLRDDTLYVAESDAGRVSLFALDGAAKGSIAIPVAQGAPSAYPSDIAMLGDDRFVVVDNAGLRVLVMRSDPKATEPVVADIGSGDTETRPIQATAVAVQGDEVFVADAGDRTIKVYGSDGVFVRAIAGDLAQPLTFVGGMVVRDNELFVTDSNVGRILVLDTRTGALKHTFPDARALPRGVCTGLADGVLLVDAFERSVFLTTDTGRIRDRIDGTVTGDGELGSPRDVAWSETTTQLFVTDASSGRVLAFKMRVFPE